MNNDFRKPVDIKPPARVMKKWGGKGSVMSPQAMQERSAREHQAILSYAQQHKFGTVPATFPEIVAAFVSKKGSAVERRTGVKRGAKA